MKSWMKGRRAKALLLGAVALVLAGVVAVCFCCVRIETPQQRQQRLASEVGIAGGWSSLAQESQQWTESVSSGGDGTAEESSAVSRPEGETAGSASSEQVSASSQVASSPEEETFSQALAEEPAGEEPTSAPLPTPSQPAASSQTSQADTPRTNIVTVSISCKNALPYAEELGLSLPGDGMLLGAVQWEFTGTATVWDAFAAVCAANGIEYRSTGITSPYIRQIAGLGEMDCGPTSGWVYYLNGNFSSQGVGTQQIVDGDVIQFAYTVTPGDSIPQ